MPVYNEERYLPQAIESILGQTYQDIEVIIVNDGSSDRSEDIILSYHDPRIRYVKQDNRGLAVSLNHGLSLARGEYIARMDADDVSFPLRLERQVSFLENNAAYVLVGTWAEIWSEEQKTRRIHKHPSSDALLRTFLLFDNPFVHSSVMFRTEVARRIGGYAAGDTGRFAEDYEFWSRLAREGKVANIPEVLHVYRERHGSITDRWKRGFMASVVIVSIRNIELLMGKMETAVVDDIVHLYHKQFRTCHTELLKVIGGTIKVLKKAWSTYGFKVRGALLYAKILAIVLVNYYRNFLFLRTHADSSHR